MAKEQENSIALWRQSQSVLDELSFSSKQIQRPIEIDHSTSFGHGSSESRFSDLAKFSNHKRKTDERSDQIQKSKNFLEDFPIRIYENDVEILQDKIATVTVILENYRFNKLTKIDEIELNIPGLKRVKSLIICSIQISPNCSTFSLSLKNISNTKVIFLF